MMESRSKKILLSTAVLLALLCSSFVQGRLNKDRAAMNLTRLDRPLENAPPALAFATVALGGFRGLIANGLWSRMNDLQLDQRFFEMVQLSDWITTLQPHYAQVWRHQAWNMAYNISIKFRDPKDRWFWVSRGIELLRDKAIPINPHDADLYQELGWHLNHKVGYYTDDAHVYFKQQYALEMMKVFGPGELNIREFLDPQTEDAKARTKLLVEKYRMDPGILAEVDEEFGPLEWRLPEAHALYWGRIGLRYREKGSQYHLRLLVYQSMQMAVLRGRFTLLPGLGQFEASPNLALIDKANDAYEKMIEESPEDDRFRMAIGHRNFLKDAVYLMYTHNRIADANRWFKVIQQKYPDDPEDVVKITEISLDDFAVGRATEWAGRYSLDRTKALVEGMLLTAYLRLSIGDEDQAAGLQALATKIWQRNQDFARGQEERMALKPMSEFRREIVDRLLKPESGLTGEMRAQLRTALNLPAPTNAPPSAAAPKP
jgi:hypothetical protein